MTRPLLAVSLALALAAAATPALAQSAADVATARDLFTEGLHLRDAGKLEEALVKLRAAHDLYDTPPSSLELAKTLAMTGKLAEAEETANAVRRIPASSKESAHSRQARAEAQKLAEDLHARVPTLTVTATGPTGGVTLTLDGAPMPASLLGIVRRLDPGKHTVGARTPGGQVVTRAVTLAERDAKTLELVIPTDAERPPSGGGVAGTPKDAGGALGVREPKLSAEEERARKFGALYKFIPPAEDRPGDTWTARDAAGAVICSLPCEHWLSETGGVVLVRVRDGEERRVELPANFPAMVGAALTVRPHAGKGVAALGYVGGVLGSLGFIGLLVGVPFLVVGLAVSDTDASKNDFVTAGLVSTVASGTAFGLGLALSFTNASSYAEITPAMTIPQAPATAARSVTLRVTF